MFGRWLVIVAIFINTCIQSYQGRPCGYQKKCSCYQYSRIASCTRKSLTEMPYFHANEIRTFDRLYLRWNFIRDIRPDPHFKSLKLIDLRNNPIQCEVVTNWDNLLVDCIKTVLPHTTEKSVITTNPTTFSSPIVTQNSPPEIDSSNPDPVTFKTLSPSYAETISMEKVDSQVLPSSVTTPRKIQVELSPTLPSTDTVIMSSESASSDGNNVEFYLHVTLGPMAVLYIITTIFLIIRRHLRNRRRRDTTSSFEM
jgi:hypothetical protein